MTREPQSCRCPLCASQSFFALKPSLTVFRKCFGTRMSSVACHGPSPGCLERVGIFRPMCRAVAGMHLSVPRPVHGPAAVFIKRISLYRDLIEEAGRSHFASAVVNRR